MVSIDEIVAGLKRLDEHNFTLDNVYEFLAANPIDTDSLSPYLFWSDKFYTRNLIHRQDSFEVMALCWEQGQISRVHDHADQNCWMSVVSGTLRGQNFAVEEFDESAGTCRLIETSLFDITGSNTAKVELEEPIHQILNLSEFGQRAISVHVYSRPITRCRSFCRETDTFKDVDLFYTSVDGRLCDGITL